MIRFIPFPSLFLKIISDSWSQNKENYHRHGSLDITKEKFISIL